MTKKKEKHEKQYGKRKFRNYWLSGLGFFLNFEHINPS